MTLPEAGGHLPPARKRPILTTTLYLLRHAKSSWADVTVDDHDRPLRNKGCRRAARLAAWLEERSLGCDLVLCSTALRARQTLEIVRPVLGSPEVRFDDGIYRADARALVALLRLTPAAIGRVMVVGHDPVLQMTAQCLALSASGDTMDRLTRKYSTSAFAMLTFGSADWASLSRGMGHLELFHVPPDP